MYQAAPEIIPQLALIFPCVFIKQTCFSCTVACMCEFLNYSDTALPLFSGGFLASEGKNVKHRQHYACTD